MRSRAVLLIVLMMGMSVSPIAMADSTISSSTTWSGNVVLSGNVTVDASTTLVIESGTVVDAQSYWLQIDGTLEASDAQFMTTETSTSPGSTGAGLWGGIKISYGGSAVLSNVSISGAESALEVHGDATIHESISIMNSYIGFDIGFEFEVQIIDQPNFIPVYFETQTKTITLDKWDENEILKLLYWNLLL